MLEMLRIYLEIAIDGEGEPGGTEPTIDAGTETPEGTEDTTPEGTETVPDKPEEQFFELDGEKLTPQQIKEYKQGFLRQSDYTKKTQEIANQRKQHQEAIELYEYLKANPHITEKLAELDTEGAKIPNQNSLKIDPVLQQMQVQLKSMEIDNELSSIKATDPDINEIEIIGLASEKNWSIKDAYNFWRGANFDKIMKDKLAKQSSELTETIKKQNGTTKTLMKPNDNTNSKAQYGLTAAEMAMADKLDMTYEEYHKWK